MTMSTERWLSHAVALMVWICLANAVATAAGAPHYVVTNDDIAPTSISISGVSFFTVGAGGMLTFQQQVQTGGAGIGGGYFPQPGGRAR